MAVHATKPLTLGTVDALEIDDVRDDLGHREEASRILVNATRCIHNATIASLPNRLESQRLTDVSWLLFLSGRQLDQFVRLAIILRNLPLTKTRDHRVRFLEPIQQHATLRRRVGGLDVNVKQISSNIGVGPSERVGGSLSVRTSIAASRASRSRLANLMGLYLADRRRGRGTAAASRCSCCSSAGALPAPPSTSARLCRFPGLADGLISRRSLMAPRRSAPTDGTASTSRPLTRSPLVFLCEVKRFLPRETDRSARPLAAVSLAPSFFSLL
eukprot:CAMPEP_0197487104 /NCGR_PEP_ID=MMETSP1311-20131121/2120_1 /TAXON_ID=464262 /ORGANISM="Genus nov. species nov., Strain RCC856" /LENGTH=271 /DNA_ID=CAMNT_0043030597 /DNA_START=299 /DNA_END=1112 /DNA_ORIENTATION=+